MSICCIPPLIYNHYYSRQALWKYKAADSDEELVRRQVNTWQWRKLLLVNGCLLHPCSLLFVFVFANTGVTLAPSLSHLYRHRHCHQVGFMIACLCVTTLTRPAGLRLACQVAGSFFCVWLGFLVVFWKALTEGPPSPSPSPIAGATTKAAAAEAASGGGATLAGGGWAGRTNSSAAGDRRLPVSIVTG
jgi:hypothetical protein